MTKFISITSAAIVLLLLAVVSADAGESWSGSWTGPYGVGSFGNRLLRLPWVWLQHAGHRPERPNLVAFGRGRAWALPQLRLSRRDGPRW
jgi:hypothetical protein